MNSAPIEFQHTLASDESGGVIELLQQKTGLSKSKLKQAMEKGAVWLLHPKKSNQRLRRATTVLKAGQTIALYYDEALLAREPLPATCLADLGRYSVWYKPAGMLSQGNWYGDHCALLRYVEKHFAGKRQAFLVHRLDREAQGLILVAHDSKACGLLSQLFSSRDLHKYYQIEVKGQLAALSGSIDKALDGKASQTHYNVTHYVAEQDISQVQVRLDSGRKHQIRRHFAAIGHPVMGDPEYGQGNKNQQGLRLVAWKLVFNCPFGKVERAFMVPDALNPLTTVQED